MAKVSAPLTEAEAITILRSRASRRDIDAIRSEPEGEALFAIPIAILTDSSRRLDRSITARHLLQRSTDVSPIAEGLKYAEVTLPLKRKDSSISNIQITLPRGMIALSDDGHPFSLLSDVVFASGQNGPLNGNFRAVLPGYGSTQVAGSINHLAPVAGESQGDSCTIITEGSATVLIRGAGDLFLKSMEGMYLRFAVPSSNAGAIARILSVDEGTQRMVVETTRPTPLNTGSGHAWRLLEWSDLGFSVSQPSDTTQGSDGELEAIAEERGRPKLAGESDDQLRSRLLRYVDMVSPNACRAVAQKAASTYGTVVISEKGTTERDYTRVSSEGTLYQVPYYEPCPTNVADLSAADVRPDLARNVVLGIDQSIPKGYNIVGHAGAFFYVRWDGEGLGESGGYALDSHLAHDGLPDEPDDGGIGLPQCAAADVSPCDGDAWGDVGIRRSISAALNRIKGAGVQWTFLPRRWVDQTL